MSHKIYFRKSSSSVWKDITNYIQGSPEWIEVLSSSFATAQLETITPKDSEGNYIYPDTGDYILILENELFNTDPLFYGIIDDPNQTIVGYDRYNDLYLYSYHITAIEKDFSNSNTFTASYTKKSLAYIINDILKSYSDGLGGLYLSSGTPITINKYLLRAYNETIDYIEFNNLSCKDAIYQLASQVNLYVKIKNTIVKNDTNICDVYSSIILLGLDGITPADGSEWINGITNESYRDFIIQNNSYTIDNNQPEYIPSETNLRLTKDKSAIRNVIKLVVNSFKGLFNISNPDGTSQYLDRYETVALINQDTYTLPYAAENIHFVSQQITSRIQQTPAPTVNTFDIDVIAWSRINNGDVCRVRINNIDYFRKIFKTGTKTVVMKDLVDGTTTLDLPSIPNYNDYNNFEIVGNQTIQLDNQVNYASWGVVKNVTQDEKAQIRFLENSLPPPAEKIIVYYTRIEPYKKQYFHNESIKKYGIHSYTFETDYLSTAAMFDNIGSVLEQPNPLVSLEMTSYRPKSPVKVGWIIPVNLTDSSTQDFYQGNLLVYEVRNKLVGYDDSFQNARIIQEIKLQEYRVNLEDLLANIKRQIAFYEPTGTTEVINKQIETISVQCFIDYETNKILIIPPTYNLTLTENTITSWSF